MTVHSMRDHLYRGGPDRPAGRPLKGRWEGREILATLPPAATT